MCIEIWNRSAPSSASFRLPKGVRMRHYCEHFLATLRQKHIQGSIEGTLAMQWFALCCIRSLSQRASCFQRFFGTRRLQQNSAASRKVLRMPSVGAPALMGWQECYNASHMFPCNAGAQRTAFDKAPANFSTECSAHIPMETARLPSNKKSGGKYPRFLIAMRIFILRPAFRHRNPP